MGDTCMIHVRERESSKKVGRSRLEADGFVPAEMGARSAAGNNAASGRDQYGAGWFGRFEAGGQTQIVAVW